MCVVGIVALILEDVPHVLLREGVDLSSVLEKPRAREDHSKWIDDLEDLLDIVPPSMRVEINREELRSFSKELK